MRVIPVLDLLGGVVVRGIAGRRKEYQPIVSRLTTSTHPLEVAQAFREYFGLTTFYVADLDAIGGEAPALDVYGKLRAAGFHILVDFGVCDLASATRAADKVDGIVAGLETLAGPETVDQLCRAYGGKLIFSLDLKDGRPLGNLAAWNTLDPLAIAERALAGGVRRMIVLDLARVGVNDGTGTESLCFNLAEAYPDLFVIVGGGIRGAEDLRRLEAGGVKGALVASALHDGRLSREDMRRMCGQ